MAAKPKTSNEAADYFQAFLCAGIADLCRLVKLPDLTDFCPETPFPRRASTVALLPASPAAAQLSLYLLLVTRGLQPKHKVLYPHSDRLRDLLRRVYRKAIKAWDDGNLKDADELQPGVRTLAKFARRNIPGFEHTAGGLEAFGVTSVERSLAILTEKLAMTFARKIAKNPAKAPAELIGASLVASAASPGVIESLGDDHTVRGLMRLGVRAGLSGAGSGKAGNKSAALDDLRKFLKRAYTVLDT
jgi:hypothetical protein